ncbi:MAG: cytidine deaminase [Clostridiales bacterium]|nr:cytidine deaminase [Clostridiales bacterium]
MSKNTNDEINKRLMKEAEKARLNAYVPYSHFSVGAALMTESGEIYTGCNIESASFGATNCAERTAIFKAVSEGHRNIKKIAIISNLNETYPCGICRQVIAEFGLDAEIIIGNEDNFKILTMDEILPHSFTKKDLDKSEKVEL